MSQSSGSRAVYRQNARLLEVRNFTPAYMKGCTNGRTYVRMILSETKFLGCVDNQIFLGGVYMTPGRLSRRREITLQAPSHGSIFVYMWRPQNVISARVTPAWVDPGCCTGARISLSRNGIMKTRNDHPFRCEIGLLVDWNGWRMRFVCDFESHVYFINMKCTFK